jgi:type I restriction enzyme R subunit
MNKKQLTETDIITKYILPAVIQKGWDSMTQIRQEVKLRDGKVIVRGQVAARKKVKSADIVLYHKPNLHLAVIEAKANKHEIGKGMQQALGYAGLLEPPFVFASNGDGFIFHDKTATLAQSKPKFHSINFHPPAEQTRIVAKVNELMTFCDQLKSQLQTGQQTKINLAQFIAQEVLNA